MAIASKRDELEDYSKEQLNKTVWQIKELEGEENDKPDIDTGGNEEVRESEEVSDPENEACLLTLQQTWWPTTHALQVKPFEKPVS